MQKLARTFVTPRDGKNWMVAMDREVHRGNGFKNEY